MELIYQAIFALFIAFFALSILTRRSNAYDTRSNRNVYWVDLISRISLIVFIVESIGIAALWVLGIPATDYPKLTISIALPFSAALGCGLGITVGDSRG